MNKHLDCYLFDITQFAREITALGTKCSPYLAKQMLKEKDFGVRKMQRKLSYKTGY